MIIGYVGDMGSGKTLSMVKMAYSLYSKGYTIFSNFRLNFPFQYFSLDEILGYAENDTNFINTVFLVDEAHIFMDSRASMTKRNLILSYFILQTRKKNVWLFFTTQYYHQIDKRLRASSNAIVECSSKVLDNGSMYVLNVFNIMKSNKIVTKNFAFYGNKYFDLFNTNEIIRPI
jgi:hypothetical protein